MLLRAVTMLLQPERHDMELTTIASRFPGDRESAIKKCAESLVAKANLDPTRVMMQDLARNDRLEGTRVLEGLSSVQTFFEHRLSNAERKATGYLQLADECLDGGDIATGVTKARDEVNWLTATGKRESAAAARKRLFIIEVLDECRPAMRDFFLKVSEAFENLGTLEDCNAVNDLINAARVCVSESRVSGDPRLLVPMQDWADATVLKKASRRAFARLFRLQPGQFAQMQTEELYDSVHADVVKAVPYPPTLAELAPRMLLEAVMADVQYAAGINESKKEIWRVERPLVVLTRPRGLRLSTNALSGQPVIWDSDSPRAPVTIRSFTWAPIAALDFLPEAIRLRDAKATGPGEANTNTAEPHKASEQQRILDRFEAVGRRWDNVDFDKALAKQAV